MLVIEMTDIVKSYRMGGGELKALKGVTLTIEAGEFVAIIGHSGSGKSTLMQIMGLLDRPTSGKYFLLGRDVTSLSDDEGAAFRSQTLGFVFQQFNLFPHLNVLENLCEAPVLVRGESRSEAEARAIQLLDRVGLAAKKDEPPRNLSGGQMQRVAIARTLMMKPQAILFDEPTSALDPVMAEEVLAVMADLARNGQTMIVVTHSMMFARNVASKVHVFADGFDVECGPPAAIFENPQHAVTKAFLKRATRG